VQKGKPLNDSGQKPSDNEQKPSDSGLIGWQNDYGRWGLIPIKFRNQN